MTTIVKNDKDAPAVTQEDVAMSTLLAQGFRMSADGWAYPNDGEPLVRVRINGLYVMERRRTVDGIWMVICEKSVEDFDQRAFEQWTEHWQLAA